MKVLLFFILLIFASLINNYSATRSPALSIVFMRGYYSTPVAISKEDFWNYTEFLDTVQIVSKRLPVFLRSKLSGLTPSKEDGISNNAVFIFTYPEEKKMPDTFYTDQLLYRWEHKDKVYIDKTKYFGGLFKALFFAE